MAGAPDLESKLDELYAGEPDDFVKSRNDLAKRLTKAGDKDAAAEVRALRKPTRAAALVNELSRDNAKQIDALVKAGEKLRDVATMSDQKKLRAAVASERKTVQALIDIAQRKAGGAGATAATLERVGETLRAVVSDPELADLVRGGRLDAEREASTIGFEFALPAAGGRSDAKSSKRRKDAAAKQQRAKLERLKADLASAEKLEADSLKRAKLAEDQLERARTAAKDAAKTTEQVKTEIVKFQRTMDPDEH